MKVRFGPDLEGLRTQMSTLLSEAAHDLHILNPNLGPVPEALTERFLGWCR